MKPTITMKTEEMQAALRQYAATSKRDLATIVNQKAYSVLIKAAAQNRVADRAKIQAELGQQATAIRGQKVRFLKGGGIKRGKIITEKIYSSALYAIVLWKAAKKGIKLQAGELERAARVELSRRLSAVSFMKSGWFAALENVAKSIGKSLKPANMKRAKRAFGGSTPAKFSGPRALATFFNTSFSKPENSTDTNAKRWAEDALGLALDQETANIRQRLAAKLQASAKRQGSVS